MVMPAVVRVSEVDGGSTDGLGRSWDGPKVPCMFRAKVTVGRSARNVRRFMVWVVFVCGGWFG